MVGRIATAAVVLASLGVLGAIPASAHAGTHASATALASRTSYIRSVVRYEIPDARLVDMDGTEFLLRERLASAAPVMLNFVFTSCTAICPVMSGTFARVQESLGNKRGGPQFISISIDPEHDTPARLREYAEKFSAGPRWRFVTGSAEASLAVQRAFDVFRGNKMSHDPVTFIRAAPGEPWVRLEGFADASDLIREYQRIVRR